MNFGMLKNMVENLVSSYKCPFCSSTNITEKNIDIVWAAGNTVNIDMHCPSCEKHFMAKTEVVHMELWNLPADKVAQIKNSLQALQSKMWGNIDIEAQIIPTKNNSDQKILDENIVDLQKNLKKQNLSLRELFGEDELWQK